MENKLPAVYDTSHWERIPDFALLKPRPILVITKATVGYIMASYKNISGENQDTFSERASDGKLRYKVGHVRADMTFNAVDLGSVLQLSNGQYVYDDPKKFQLQASSPPTPPPPPTEKSITRAVVYFDDGTSEELRPL